MNDEPIVGIYRHGESWVVFQTDEEPGEKIVAVKQPVDALGIAKRFELGDTTEETWRKRDEAHKRLVKVIADDEGAYEDELRDTKARLNRLTESYAKAIARTATMAARLHALENPESE